MSNKTGFVLKHEELLESLKDTTNQNCYGSQNEMSLAGEFPCLGLFLAAPIIDKQSGTYVELEHIFLFGAFDRYDRDDPDSEKTVQYSTYEALVDAIDKMNFEVTSDPEPMIGLAFGDGSFISGWTLFVKYNA